MLHVWLLPAMIVFSLGMGVFYLVVRFSGGSGVRTDGRTLVDKPEPKDPP